MTAVLTWEERLANATSEEEVVEVARDYLATLSHTEFALLPEKLRPHKIVDASDITTYAFELVRHECEESSQHRLVQRIAHIMSRASIRLAQIMVDERDAVMHPARRHDDVRRLN
jgi:pheromone shutdown protein TraB